MKNADLHNIENLSDKKIILIMEELNIDEDMLPQFKAYASNYLYKTDLEYFEESYAGEWDSDEDFTQNLLESCGEIPQSLPHYIHIDWSGTARDIMMDYFEVDSYYFRKI